MNDQSQAFYRFNDEIYSGNAQTGDGKRPSFQELEMAANARVGPGRYFTSIFAAKCVRNWFDFYDWDGNFVKKQAIKKALYHAKFMTEQIFWAAYELIYGISFLVKYWTMHDKYDMPPPNKPFKSCKAFPPTILSPVNIVDTNLLSEDEEKWEFYGGKYQSFKIHPGRIEVLCTRPNPNSWIGFSILEGIYLSYAAYMNLIVNGIKNVAKYGNVVTAFKMAEANPSLVMYNEFRDLVEEMKATYTFVLGKDEEIEFHETKMGTGLGEFGEFLKEDMAAGTGLPLNQTYGRADGGGLAGAGALISKESELETISNYQADIADNYWLMISRYFNVDDLFVKFRLESQKTDRARYEDEMAQWEIEMIKANVEATKLNTLVSAMQFQEYVNNPQMQSGIANQSGGDTPANQIGNQDQAAQLPDKSTPLDQIKKANQDFIDRNNETMKNFRPRVIDIAHRPYKKKKRKW